ncbi:MAG: GNAT family acetyltransferase [Actinomycetota bacterium]|nr:GNAT family acetyltransferase [Actinomycetota bacterium]
MEIRQFESHDRDALIALWEACELTRPWNNPGLDIDRKLSDSPWGLLVLEADKSIVGSVMVGFDGHRGWINYLAAAPSHRRQGIASQLMTVAEELLLARGCPKVNLQVRDGNDEAIQFYAARGYANDGVTSWGYRLIHD